MVPRYAAPAPPRCAGSGHTSGTQSTHFSPEQEGDEHDEREGDKSQVGRHAGDDICCYVGRELAATP